MKTIYCILLGVLIMCFSKCDCGGGRNVHDQNTKEAVEQADTMYVPPVPEEEKPEDGQAAPSFGKGKNKWNYPTPVPQPPPTTTTSCAGTLCIYIEFEGGVMQHPAYNGGQPVTLLNSGFTEEQKEQVLAVAQSYFTAPVFPYQHTVIVTRDINVYNASTNRLKTYVTQSAWYNGGPGGYGGYTSASCTYTNCNDCVNFIYTTKLAMHPRYNGQMVAHEGGHWLDYNHIYETVNVDGVNQTRLKWGVIMGNPLTHNPASW